MLAQVATALLVFALVRADGRLGEEKAAGREIAHVLAVPDARAVSGSSPPGSDDRPW
ncbi:hypothetical protein [Streptomyces sp. NPDC017941]|uniref:hypothetical protein n=1 Tax=Streptomyces sp. NPDC017941 TaxID=3365018 RepID=UPI00378BB5AB